MNTCLFDESRWIYQMQENTVIKKSLTLLLGAILVHGN